jgi:twitching motility protein PilT
VAELIRDADLDALVREINRSDPDLGGAAAVPAGADGGPTSAMRREIGDDDALAAIVAQVVARSATDLLLVAGATPVLRVDGRLVATAGEPLAEDDIRALLRGHADRGGLERLRAEGSLDFSLRYRPGGEAAAGGRGAWRFRVNVHFQRGTLAAALRVLPRQVPTLESLHLPAGLAELIRPARGLVLLCGPAGSGKTSTLAALVGEINRTRTCHMVTIEDPIEYEHPNVRSIVEQVEVGADAPSFAAALRASLRQDPDVLLVGEMRDLESIATALTAAETGHLVLSTLHTGDAAQAIHRLVDVFPAQQQGQIRQQLALVLHAVVSQQLVPRADGRGRVPAVEVLLANPAVRHLIRKERVESLGTEITLGKRLGMVSIEESLAQLVRAGLVAAEEARLRASHPEELETLLRGRPSVTPEE